MPDGRPPNSRSGDRPPFAGTRPPFRPGPRPEFGPGIAHTLRLRDGDREIEVHGSAMFVRQVLDELPSLWPRLHGEGSSRPSRISMPAAPPRDIPVPATAPPSVERPAAVETGNGRSLDDRVIAVLRSAERPLAVAAIRKRLGDGTTPQQVRRVLERNANRVAVNDDRPATYRLR
jgi:hypothetical protein